MPYATVVVGTDGSPSAELAVRAAAEVAVGDGAHLVVVAAFAAARPDAERDPHGGPAAPLGPQRAPADQHNAEAVAARGGTLAEDLGIQSVTVLAGAGPASDVLLASAAAHGADLIVVGSQGMTGPSRFVLGGVANTVSHHATCDVLVVHTT